MSPLRIRRTENGSWFVCSLRTQTALFLTIHSPLFISSSATIAFRLASAVDQREHESGLLPCDKSVVGNAWMTWFELAAALK
ncbi:MAG: hypothetical protein A4C66_11185 [Nitrospira sp. HN-bin3]|nr:MAG: hypothetical protein A4C66_11185 [Nitrospira sp. HN-bin3]